jgi:UDP-glucose 4-epimerase
MTAGTTARRSQAGGEATITAKVVIVGEWPHRGRGSFLTICIYGGTGFIGRHLCEALSQRGISAMAISRKPDRDFLERFAPTVSGISLGSPEVAEALKRAEIIFYLASGTRPASSPLDPSHELTQVAHGVELINILRETNPRCHVIYTSSGGQIYGAGHVAPIAETAMPMPATAYALGKLMMENMLTFSARVSGLGVTILRLANPVGRWQLGRGHGFVSAAVASLQSKALTVFGDGGNVRDYFDADELGLFLARFADPAFRPQGTYNIGSGQGVTEREVIAMLEGITGRTIPVAFAAARPFDLRYAVLNVERARDELGWKPRADLRSTMRRILDHVPVLPGSLP